MGKFNRKLACDIHNLARLVMLGVPTSDWTLYILYNKQNIRMSDMLRGSFWTTAPWPHAGRAISSITTISRNKV
jgi:hypothetical protein